MKERIIELLKDYKYELQVENVYNVDSMLETLDHVVTSDAVILDRCKSWINLNKRVIEEYMDEVSVIDFEIH